MERRDQILELAERLLRTHGYAAFSYRDMAKELGITSASLHYHFERKEDLALALCDRLEEGIRLQVEKLRKEHRFPAAVLRKFMEARVRHVKQDEICPISALQSDLETLPPALQDRVRALSGLELEVLQDLLREAQHAGELDSKPSARIRAGMILSGIKGALQYGRVLGGSFRAGTVDHILKRLGG